MESSPQSFDLGAWVGRQQAFGLIANKCSAAQSLALKEIKESHAYEQLGLSWEDFCKQHAGITREYADRLIRRHDELGETYVRLSELARISPETYRQISGHVDDEGEFLEFDGEEIELIPEKAPQIQAAINTLRARLRAANRNTHPMLSEIQARQDALLADVSRMVNLTTPTVVKPYIREIGESAIRTWARLIAALDPKPSTASDSDHP